MLNVIGSPTIRERPMCPIKKIKDRNEAPSKLILCQDKQTPWKQQNKEKNRQRQDGKDTREDAEADCQEEKRFDRSTPRKEPVF
jgi:hypothetical protein